MRLDTRHTAGASDWNCTASPDEAEAVMVNTTPTHGACGIFEVKAMSCGRCPPPTGDEYTPDAGP